MSLKPILERLDAIEAAKRRSAQAHYIDAGLEEPEVHRLADLMASTPIRLIAEEALSHLEEDKANDILQRFEPLDQPPHFSNGGDYWYAYGPGAQAWIKGRYVGEKATPFFTLRESETDFQAAAIAAGFVLESFAVTNGASGQRISRYAQ